MTDKNTTTCALCSKPIFSVRNAIAETDLPPDTGSAEAIRELWRRLESGWVTSSPTSDHTTAALAVMTKGGEHG